MDPDDGPALANLTHDHKLTFRTEAVGGICKVTDLAFNWNSLSRCRRPWMRQDEPGHARHVA